VSKVTYLVVCQPVRRSGAGEQRRQSGAGRVPPPDLHPASLLSHSTAPVSAFRLSLTSAVHP